MLKNKTLSYLNNNYDEFQISSLLGIADLYEIREKFGAGEKSYLLFEDVGDLNDYFDKKGHLKKRVAKKYIRIIDSQYPYLQRVFFVFFDGKKAHHAKLI